MGGIWRQSPHNCISMEGAGSTVKAEGGVFDLPLESLGKPQILILHEGA
jgi:hypothetical protein